MSRSRPRERVAPESSETTAATLKARWRRLHLGDREPFPEPSAIQQLAHRQSAFAATVPHPGGTTTLAAGLCVAWNAFHAGQFAAAARQAAKLGALGAVVGAKAVAVYSLYPATSDRQVTRKLQQAVTGAEAGVALLPDYANAHYGVALLLGRYSQRLSILTALAQGLAGRVRSHLDRTLELEPRHAEAHIALGLYHAEIVAKLGGLAARLTYSASADAARTHFERALSLTPHAPIALLEYARGLQLLDAHGNRAQARTLLERATRCEPADAMERLDMRAAAAALAVL